MGLLALGTALDWPEAKKQAHLVRSWGIKQLLEIWNKAKGKERDAMLWGDEVEYLVVTYSKDDPKVLLSLRQADILKALADDKALSKHGCAPPLPDGTNALISQPPPVFHPEFGRFMLEATPGKPWGIEFKELLEVEPNMKLRRCIAKEHMLANEYPITLTTFPRIGSPGVFTEPSYPVSGPRLRSQFVPDEIANPHIRFPTLAANIRSRRGRKVQVNVPVFRDENTPWPWRDPTVNFDLHQWPEDDDVRQGAAPDNFIHMDAMAFGMGSCCLQITFQAKNLTEGRQMYDQLSPLGPILLALTAATPVYKGFLAETDVRWNQISRAVDDRTPEELGEKPLVNDRWRIPKSRYASNSTYISEDPRLRVEYMDPDLVIDEDIKQQLLDGGMDDRLATHFAHLFIRDPIVIFSEDLKELDLSKTDHFENIQSTNWQHMRFKPPPADNSIGWRVEFRPMEIQVTDFENAAFAVFMVLITRVILSFDLNFYIPITKVDENMETAHARDAVLNQRFFFRRNLFPTTRTARSSASGASTPVVSRPPTPTGPVEDEYRLMTVNEIINGTAYAKATAHFARASQANPEPYTRYQDGDGISSTSTNNGASKPAPPTSTSTSTDTSTTSTTSTTTSTSTDTTSSSSPFSTTSTSDDDEDDQEDFPGLIPLVESYLDAINIDVDTRCRLASYLDLIRRRASGELWTAARWIRHFVSSHPEYKRDSVVGEGVVKDLVGAVVKVGEREGRGGRLGCGKREGEEEGDGMGEVRGLERLLGGLR